MSGDATRGCPSRRAILVGGAALSVAARGGAQPRTYRLGILSPSSAAAGAQNLAALLGRLESLGYRVGQNLVVERRFAGLQLDRLSALAAELVALKPDIVVTIGTQATLAAVKVTRTIPIVFVAVSNPEAEGIVKSLRKPGTNATGLSNQADEYQIKLLQLLKETFSAASDVAVLHHPANAPEVRGMKQAAKALGVNLRAIEARTPGDLAPAFSALNRKRPDVLYVVASPLVNAERERIVALANVQRQPAVYGLIEFAEAGGLMSYSYSILEQHRAAATFIDKILRGASPATLPVEQPTRFELVLNLRTAKAQGITFAPAVLLRADRLIE